MHRRPSSSSTRNMIGFRYCHHDAASLFVVVRIGDWKALPFGALIGDKAFDADWLPSEAKERSAVPVIPPKRSLAATWDHDRETCRWRHQVEKFFAGIKELRAMATRHEKRTRPSRRRFTSSLAWLRRLERQSPLEQHPETSLALGAADNLPYHKRNSRQSR